MICLFFYFFGVSAGSAQASLEIKSLAQKRGQDNFLTIVNPVRSRALWQDQLPELLANQIATITDKNLKVTWLLAYDTLYDQEILTQIKSLPLDHEVGAFLEVSEKLATDAQVSYKVADGDYYRPDKVFLSGYSPADRKKLIKTYFDKFYKVFGQYPKSVGAWYIDANSQNYLSKLGVNTALTVADQFDTDAASVWGKYFSYPFYPSKNNSLEPAQNQSDKIPIANIQWAQRDPVLGYGPNIKDSRHSFQANDYLNNHFDFAYFEDLINTYLGNYNTDFVQMTLGLEAGQEAGSFHQEFSRQLDLIKNLKESGKLKVLTMTEFANWYQGQYPQLSPSHFLQKGENIWYMSSKFRVAIFKEGHNFYLKDLRYWSGTPFKDYLYADNNKFLDRKTVALIDNVDSKNQLDLGQSQSITIKENFDGLIVKLDDKEIVIDSDDVHVKDRILAQRQKMPDFRVKLKVLLLVDSLKRMLAKPLSLLRFSKIDSERVVGIAIAKTSLLGFRSFSFGIYTYEFQSFNKFLSGARLLERWHPWIN